MSPSVDGSSGECALCNVPRNLFFGALYVDFGHSCAEQARQLGGELEKKEWASRPGEDSGECSGEVKQEACGEGIWTKRAYERGSGSPAVTKDERLQHHLIADAPKRCDIPS